MPGNLNQIFRLFDWIMGMDRKFARVYGSRSATAEVWLSALSLVSRLPWEYFEAEERPARWK